MKKQMSFNKFYNIHLLYPLDNDISDDNIKLIYNDDSDDDDNDPCENTLLIYDDDDDYDYDFKNILDDYYNDPWRKKDNINYRYQRKYILWRYNISCHSVRHHVNKRKYIKKNFI
jgi:hypothetical protein